jgi:hypothetical protein
VLRASGHIMNVNTKALELAGLLEPGVENHPGHPARERRTADGRNGKAPRRSVPVGPPRGVRSRACLYL